MTVRNTSMRQTPLTEVHRTLGAKLVEFAGYEMPLVYSGIVKEHNAVRSSVGIFDISHMGEIIFSGTDSLHDLQRLTINDVSKLQVEQAQYSAMCNEKGGIIDDVLLYRYADRYMMIVNASNQDKDIAWIQSHKSNGTFVDDVSDTTTLLAVQGPQSGKTLQPLTAVDLSSTEYYHFSEGALAGVQMTIARTGYTGAYGFELYFNVKHARTVWNAVLEAGEPYGILPIGLGARDSLRMEMKFCLYGNDISEEHNPIEAGLKWITKPEKGDFIGRDAILRILESGPSRRFVGFIMMERTIPRQGYAILKDESPVGMVTSGIFSPSRQQGIGLGYVQRACAKIGTEITIDVRGKHQAAHIVKMPFIESSVRP